jgi:hypothetical protein
MKYFSVVFFFIFLGKLYAQQPVKNELPKLHAFAKEIIGGANLGNTIDENGTVKQNVQPPSLQYYFYVETSANFLFTIQYIWMEGNIYKVNAEKIKLPIVVPGIGSAMYSKGDTLITASKNTFWQAPLNGRTTGVAQNSTITHLMKLNAAVLQYLHKGKVYYLCTTEIKKLSPLELQ